MTFGSPFMTDCSLSRLCTGGIKSGLQREVDRFWNDSRRPAQGSAGLIGNERLKSGGAHGAAALDDRGLLFRMEALQPLHEIDHFLALGLAAGVIFLGGPDDDVDDVREAAAAAA